MARDFGIKPRTVRETLQIMLKHIERGNLCFGFYRNRTWDGKFSKCIIGACFTRSQLSWIVSTELNCSGIHQISAQVGKDNIRAMTGMDANQLSKFQKVFDNKQHDIIRYDRMIANMQQALKAPDPINIDAIFATG